MVGFEPLVDLNVTRGKEEEKRRNNKANSIKETQQLLPGRYPCHHYSRDERATAQKS